MVFPRTYIADQALVQYPQVDHLADAIPQIIYELAGITNQVGVPQPGFALFHDLGTQPALLIFLNAIAVLTACVKNPKHGIFIQWEMPGNFGQG